MAFMSYPQLMKKGEKKPKKPPSRFVRMMTKMFLWGMGLLILMIIAIAGAATAVIMHFGKGLPSIENLKNYRPPVVTTVYSDDNRKIAEFSEERRIVIPLSQMPKTLIEAFIAAEDSRFFIHKGIDLIGIGRAFLKNIEAGAMVQGGSTITQQVIKSFLLTPERSYRRKIREAILAYRVDNFLTKDEILFLYLNQIYMGHGAYGVEAASQTFFGKSAKDMNLAECAMLAGLPKAPSSYSPIEHPEKAAERQSYVLRRMTEEGYITDEQAQKTMQITLDVGIREEMPGIENAPFYTEHVRRYVEKKYGRENLYKGGLKIYTAVNINMQKIAIAELQKGLRTLDKRQGYRGPVKQFTPKQTEEFSKEIQERIAELPLKKGKITQAVVTTVNHRNNTALVRIGEAQGILDLRDIRWARKPNLNSPNARRSGEVLRTGDLILVMLKEKIEGKNTWRVALEQTPEVQGGMLCVETHTGMVKAMVGGRDYHKTQFNRATQSRRQPGSSFKPIIYAAALDKGYTPATELLDNAVVYKGANSGKDWKPKNYDRKFYGPILLRQALAKSRNLPTIRILEDIGIDYAIKYANRLGILSPLGKDLSLALGSSGVSLLELVVAYSVFVNQGELVEPVFITKIVDRDGNIIEEHKPGHQQAIEQSTAYLITSLLESVVKEGTARRILALKRPAAGKTGTTNNLNDAWFVGFTPDYVTGTWVGFDKEQPLGRDETGGKAAAPIWLAFMKRILADLPERPFEIPEGVVFSKVDAETGLLPTFETQRTIFECFKEGSAPARNVNRTIPTMTETAEDFFKSNM